jgi:CheY-like chemotaxis protein
MKFEHEPGNLLVVDDNKVNRILLARGLEQEGHTVETPRTADRLSRCSSAAAMTSSCSISKCPR